MQLSILRVFCPSLCAYAVAQLNPSGATLQHHNTGLWRDDNGVLVEDDVTIVEIWGSIKTCTELAEQAKNILRAHGESAIGFTIGTSAFVVNL